MNDVNYFGMGIMYMALLILVIVLACELIDIDELYNATIDCMRRDSGELTTHCEWAQCPNRYSCNYYVKPKTTYERLKAYIQKHFKRREKEEDRCDICAERFVCPTFKSGVIRPCPHFKLW